MRQWLSTRTANGGACDVTKAEMIQIMLEVASARAHDADVSHPVDIAVVMASAIEGAGETLAIVNRKRA